MTCADCGASTVAFAVPDSIREHAPDEASHADLCTICLRTHPVDSGPTEPDFSAVSDAVPDGEGGIALALALGKLGSLALNRASIETLCAHAEQEGADVLLVLDRLFDTPNVRPYFDLGRRRAQVEQLLSE